MERIEARLLIPGRGQPVRDGVVVLDGPVISYTGPALGAPDTPGAVVTRAATVLPGLWDCHVHLIGLPAFDLARLPVEPAPLRAVRCVPDLRAALDTGVTSVRETGGLGVHLARAVAEGLVEGPAVYAAGAILSCTGGHGDLHSMPLQWVAGFGAGGGDLRVCDGVAECTRATREMLRRDAKLIKVCASGGVLSELDQPDHQQFSIDELRVITETAAMADRIVAAHCHGKAGIMAAIKAGARTIEHGTGLDEEACDAMADADSILVPTRTVVEEILTHRAAPPYAVEKLRAIAHRHAKAVALAHERGVIIAMGTDIAVTGGRGGPTRGAATAANPAISSPLASPRWRRSRRRRPTAPSRWGRRRRAAGGWPPGTTPTSSSWTPTRWPTSRYWPIPTTFAACGEPVAGSRAGRTP